MVVFRPQDSCASAAGASSSPVKSSPVKSSPVKSSPVKNSPVKKNGIISDDEDDWTGTRKHKLMELNEI